MYNATSSLVRFKDKKITLKKRSSLMKRWRCSYKFRSRRIGSRFRTHHLPICRDTVCHEMAPKPSGWTCLQFDQKCPTIRPKMFDDSTKNVRRFDQKCSTIRPKMFDDSTSSLFDEMRRRQTMTPRKKSQP
jgi:hypothetical protein